MSTVIETYNPDGVDEAVLRGTGSGGLLSSGYLRDDPLSSYVDENETVVFVRSNARHGVTRYQLDGSGETQFRPGDGYRTFTVVTDARVLFIIGDIRNGDGDRSIPLALADVEVVEHSEGLLAGELALTTRSDVVWHFESREDLADVAAYLDAASMSWLRLESRLEAARELVVEAEQHRERQAYDEALSRLSAATEETAAARREEQSFAPDGVVAMADRIERTESRVRDARTKTLRGRAAHSVDCAERRWRNEEYEAAYEAYRAAHCDYVDVLAVADPDFEESAPVRKKLARVERNLAALEEAPVDRAEQAHERAREAEDPLERGAHLERALERYRRALELDWGVDDRRFAGDTSELRERIDVVATDLVKTRRREAARRVTAGNEHRANGREESARAAYREARDLLDETVDAAHELVPGAVDALTELRDAIDRELGEDESAGDDRDAPRVA
ncbi:MAG: hypothetical protein V5A44_09165 [Haloarculaceae archaeon]